MQPVQAGIQPTRGQELGVAAGLDQATLMEGEDAIGGLNRAQTVGDDERRAVLEVQRKSKAIRAGIASVRERNLQSTQQTSRATTSTDSGHRWL
jgi:hypothetical protein